MSNIFLLHTLSAIKLVYVVVPSIVGETLFRDILRMIFHIDFKRANVNLHQQISDTALLPAVKQLLLHHCKHVFLSSGQFEMCLVFPGEKYRYSINLSKW